MPVTPDVARPGPVVKRELRSTLQAFAAQSRLNAYQGDKEVVCQNCGGHSMFTGTLTSLRCPYCNTPIQRDDVQDSPTRLPIDGVLPLAVSFLLRLD